MLQTLTTWQPELSIGYNCPPISTCPPRNGRPFCTSHGLKVRQQIQRPINSSPSNFRPWHSFRGSLDSATPPKVDDPIRFQLLRTIPGVGPVLALVMLYEVHDIDRFSGVGQFASYARLVACAHESNGKKLGTGGRKIGNAHLKWAFGEAAALMIRETDEAKAFVEKMTKQRGKARAVALLAAKIGRAVYWMMKRKQPYDAALFWKSCLPRSLRTHVKGQPQQPATN